jgi:hypothetical protein
MVATAQRDPTIQRYLAGRQVSRTSYLLGRLNITTVEPTNTERNEQIDNLERSRQQLMAEILTLTARANAGEPGAKELLAGRKNELAQVEQRLRTLRS